MQEFLHLFPSQKELQGINFLRRTQILSHCLLIVLVEPEPLLFVLDMLELYADVTRVSYLKVLMRVEDSGASVLESLGDAIVESVGLERFKGVELPVLSFE